MNKKTKNIIFHFTSYEKLEFCIDDFADFRIYNIRKNKYLNIITGEMEEYLYTTSAYFVLKKECDKELTIDLDGMGTIRTTPFKTIFNGCQIYAIEFVYKDGTNEYIKIALFDDSPEPENNFHCESKILENGDLYVALDENINKDLSNIKCR